MYPEFPVLARLHLLVVAADALPVGAAIEGRGRYHVLAGKQLGGEGREPPGLVLGPEELGAGDDGFQSGALLQLADGPLEEAGQQDVVGVEGQDVLPAGLADGVVAGHAHALVFLLDEAQARVGLAHALDDGEAAVAAAVIDDDDFEWGVMYLLQALQRLGHIGFFVVEGDDDGDEGTGFSVFGFHSCRCIDGLPGCGA